MIKLTLITMGRMFKMKQIFRQLSPKALKYFNISQLKFKPRIYILQETSIVHLKCNWSSPLKQAPSWDLAPTQYIQLSLRCLHLCLHSSTMHHTHPQYPFNIQEYNSLSNSSQHKHRNTYLYISRFNINTLYKTYKQDL